MNKIKNVLLLGTVIVSTLFSGVSFAEVTKPEEEKPVNENIQIIKLTQQTEGVDEIIADDKDLQSKDIQSKDFAKDIYTRHYIDLIVGDIVYLHDGSVWRLQGSGLLDYIWWNVGDVVYIRNEHAFFSSKEFIIENATRGSCAYANLCLDVTYDAYVTLYVEFIDPVTNEIFLSDGSIWRLNATALQWYRNDTVIIGANCVLFSPYTHILINWDAEIYTDAQYAGTWDYPFWMFL